MLKNSNVPDVLKDDFLEIFPSQGFFKKGFLGGREYGWIIYEKCQLFLLGKGWKNEKDDQLALKT